MTFVNHPHSCTLFAWYIFQIIIPPFQKLYHMTDTKNYKHTYLLRNISNRIWIICTVTINYCTYPINTSWLTSEWLNFTATFSSSIQWGHNEHDGVSNHQRLDCLLSRLFRWPVNSPHKGPVTRKMFPFGDVIMLYNPLRTLKRHNINSEYAECTTGWQWIE